MKFVTVTYTLTYSNHKPYLVDRQQIDSEDLSEIEWVAKNYLEVNAPDGCIRVVAEKNGKVVADVQPIKEESIVTNNVIIAGGRTFNDRALMIDRIQELEKQGLIYATTTLICGMANGADLMAREIFKQAGLNVRDMPAEWDLLGKRAGYARNESMACIADMALVFWDGQSKGSKHMIDTMDKLGKPVYVVGY
jgi:hypothetical protein